MKVLNSNSKKKQSQFSIIFILEKCYELNFGCKVVHQDKSWTPIFVVQRVWGFTQGGEVVRAKCRFSGLEGTERPLIWLLLFLNRHKRDHLQFQTFSEISTFAICSEVCPTQWRVALTKSLLKIWLLAMTALILMKITDSKKCWLLSDIWSKLFLIWTAFTNARIS